MLSIYVLRKNLRNTLNLRTFMAGKTYQSRYTIEQLLILQIVRSFCIELDVYLFGQHKLSLS